MDEGLELLLEEQRSTPLPELTVRDVRVPELPNMATTFVGMRRVGKSYLMAQEIGRLLAAGVPRSSILWLNLEDDRLGATTTRAMSDALEWLFRTGPRRYEQTAHLFLDEVQAVPEWERFVLRVLNTENVHVRLTGSSAKLLSTEVATELRGRSTAVEVLPFSFREYLRHRDLEPETETPPGAAQRSALERAFSSYLVEGGFPAVQDWSVVDRRRTLQDYVDLVVYRDVVSRWGATNRVALEWMVSHLLSNFAREFSVNRMLNDLKSQGVRVGEDTLHAYLGHLLDARLVYTVGIRRTSYRARQVNPRKVYAVDPGLASATAHPSADDVGYLLENAVYLDLRRRYSRLHDEAVSYYSDSEGSADFVVDTRASEPIVVQACTSLSDSRTRERELRGAEAAMRGTGASSATVVTLTESGTYDTSAGTVQAIPAWRWMLRTMPDTD
ncbi:MAG: ATP-binding protein [Coriobacteriales bacterium]|nr:ATP-binding protein [Coriobacteriales bacterium]